MLYAVCKLCVIGFHAYTVACIYQFSLTHEEQSNIFTYISHFHRIQTVDIQIPNRKKKKLDQTIKLWDWRVHISLTIKSIKGLYRTPLRVSFFLVWLQVYITVCVKYSHLFSYKEYWLYSAQSQFTEKKQFC